MGYFIFKYRATGHCKFSISGHCVKLPQNRSDVKKWVQ